MRFTEVGQIMFQCSSCDTRIDGTYEDVLQLMLLHRMQHESSEDKVNDLLEEMERVISADRY